MKIADHYQDQINIYFKKIYDFTYDVQNKIHSLANIFNQKLRNINEKLKIYEKTEKLILKENQFLKSEHQKLR